MEIRKNDESNRFTEKLWELLCWQVGRFNGMDSSSLTIERAEDLMESLKFTLSIVVEAEGLTPEELMTEDLRDMVCRGQDMLRQRQRALKVDWELMCRSAPAIPNVYYRLTMKSLGVFFGRYERIHEAHHVPCSIDYWLLLPVPEELQGIRYVEEYIRRFQWENDILSLFPTERLIRLYRSAVPEYEETLFNLCEPVLLQLMGLALCRANVRDLDISEGQREHLLTLLRGRTMEQILTMEEESLRLAGEQLALTDEDVQGLTAAARSLAPRIGAAAEAGDLSRVFVSLTGEYAAE